MVMPANPGLLLLLIAASATLLAVGYLVFRDLLLGKTIRLDLKSNKQGPVLTPRAVWVRFAGKSMLFAYLLFASVFHFHWRLLTAVSLVVLIANVIVPFFGLRMGKT